MCCCFCHLNRINALDMPTAVQYLKEPDANLQVLGAAYIQHECYNNNDAKYEVHWCASDIPPLLPKTLLV